MEADKNKYETPKQQTEGQPRSAGATAQNILERGTEAYGQAQKAVSDGYDKTTSSVKETYAKVKSYSAENPGKTILVTLGLGMGLGIILGAFSSYYRSRTSRYTGPVVKALSDLVHKA
jgi:ElaB/YqjD/DUF883 family membrane-anchored ribosome-binding protein